MPADKEALQKVANGQGAASSSNTLDDVSLHPLNAEALIELEDVDAERGASDSALVTVMISVLAEKPDGSRPSEAEISQLSPQSRQRIIQGIISLHPEWFRSDVADVEQASGEGISREGGETDEAYLARGFRTSMERFAVSMPKPVVLASSDLSGLSSHMKNLLSSKFAENLHASHRVGDILKSIHDGSAKFDAIGKKSADGAAQFESRKNIFPELPPNPTFKTNEILSGVKEQIGQMRDLAAATADMHRSLNDMASTALAEFSKGAEASAKSAESSLKIARISLFVSFIATILTFSTIIVSVYLANKQEEYSVVRGKAYLDNNRRLIVSQESLEESIYKLQESIELMPGDKPRSENIKNKN